jgi:hypothetical protein
MTYKTYFLMRNYGKQKSGGPIPLPDRYVVVLIVRFFMNVPDPHPILSHPYIQ